MGDLIYVLYMCIAVPMVLMLIILDNKNRWIMLYLFIGLTIGLPSAIVNRFCLATFADHNSFYLSSTFAPIVEELMKGIPVILLFTLDKKQSKEQAIACAFACGVGFAMFENIVYFYKNAQVVDLFWAFKRGIGASLMHSLTTGWIAFGVVTLRNNKKLFWSGLFSFTMVAMVYHGAFNSMIMSRSRVLNDIAAFMPIVTFLPIAVLIWYTKLAKKPFFSK